MPDAGIIYAMQRHFVHSSLFFWLALCLTISACLPGAPVAPTQAPTRTRIPYTVTPVLHAVTASPTLTRTPLATLIPSRTPTLTPDIDATARAFFDTTPTLDNLDEQAVLQELRALALPTEGQLAWHSPAAVSLSLKNYNETVFSGTAEEKEFANFILKVEITWTSRTGLAGCGVILRSETPLASGRQYQFSTLRLSGAPAWDLEFFDNGSLVPALSAEIRYDRTIQIEQGATNIYYLMARGSELTAIANQKKLGTAPLARLTKGQIGWVGFQESGQTTCVFANAWVWQLPD